MEKTLEEKKKNDDLLQVLEILKQEFEFCINRQNGKSKTDKREDTGKEKGKEEEKEKEEEHNMEYYKQLKKERDIDVLLNEYTTSLDISKKYKIEHNKLMGIIKKLETLYYIINIIKNYNTYHLTAEGNSYLEEGSPEYIALQFVKEHDKCVIEDIKKELGKKGEIGISLNLKNKMVHLNKTDKTLTLSDHFDQVGIQETKNKHIFEDKTQNILSVIHKYGNAEEELFTHLAKLKDKQQEENNTNNEDEQKMKNSSHVSSTVVMDTCNDILKELKKRKLIEVKKNTYSYIIKTSLFQTQVKKQITDLTASLLKNGEYEKYDIKKYNFFSSGKKINKGNFHLLSKQMKVFKQIFLSLGFEEMKTNTYVESSFWCFDALFIPQQHPSRDLQDTFFIQNPELAPEHFADPNYIENVKAVHIGGQYESFGWNYNWKKEEAQKNILRTHTTANSARKLFHLVQQCKQEGCDIKPKKYFSIDKVFRNENLDSTHLAEFHQVEGLIIGKNIGFGHLKGVLSAFYKKIGITNLKFKPTFNPYTEPSMEVYGFHEQHKKWMEVGNSGVFRPELLRPMGFPKDISVIAWGLSLERPTMIKYNIKNIRDLVGYKSTV